MVNYFYDCYNILNKVYSQKAFVKQAINSTFIEEKNRSMIIKTVYGVLDNDKELSFYISKLTEKSPKLVIRTILKISMYAVKYLNKQIYAVTKNAVELTKKLGKTGASGFVNAFLRKFYGASFEFPNNKIENLAIRYSYPEFAVKKVIEDYGEQRANDLLIHRTIKTCISFFIEDGERYLISKGIKYEKTPYENVFFVENFSRNEDYDKGIYTFQSIGSVAICDAVSPCENILDCCSAPGGKAVRLSFKCDRVFATDMHEHRVELIKDYAFRMKRDNIIPLVKDSTVLEKDFIDKFDAVLCDAPCSSFGVANDNPDVKLFKEENDVVNLNVQQKEILNNVSKYVKIGGYLYYSTCSIFKCENINVVEDFIKNNSNFIIEELTSKIPCDEIKGTLQFVPDKTFGLGFYVAKLKRIKWKPIY